MKDLLKGHHPAVLTAVIVVAAIFAIALRSKSLAEGYSTFNANAIMVITFLGSMTIYGLIVEGIHTLSEFICKRTWEKRGITPRTITTASECNVPIIESNATEYVQAQIDEPQNLPSETAPMQVSLSEDQIRRIADAVVSSNMAKILTSSNCSDEAENPDVITIDVRKPTDDSLQEEERNNRALINKACQYTASVLGKYMNEDKLKFLIKRIAEFKLSAGYMEKASNRITPNEPIHREDLMHFGWNIGNLFGKTNTQIAFFLIGTFAHHFDNCTITTIASKLTHSTRKGKIKRIPEWSQKIKRSIGERKKQENLQQLVREYEEQSKPKKAVDVAKKLSSPEMRQQKTRDAVYRNSDMRNSSFSGGEDENEELDFDIEDNEVYSDIDCEEAYEENNRSSRMRDNYESIDEDDDVGDEEEAALRAAMELERSGRSALEYDAPM